MRVLLKEFWMSWHTWMFIIGWTLAAGCFFWLALLAQRRDYQRANDAALVHAIDMIKVELSTIKEQNRRSIDDRAMIRREVDEVKKSVVE